MPPAAKGDLAFVEHILAVMKPDSGRLAVAMPQGVLFHAGAEKEIKKNIVAVGLPPNGRG